MPINYTDLQGSSRFPLGQWIADLHTRAENNRLSHEEIESVEALGMEWPPEPHCSDAPDPLPTAPSALAAATVTIPQQRHTPPPRATVTADTHDQEFWIAGDGKRLPGLPDVLLHGGTRMLVSMPAGEAKP